MADSERDMMSETPQQRRNETRDEEHQRVRKSNDRDQAQGDTAPHNRGYDEAADGPTNPLPSDALGMGDDVDPDSAASENDRDDMVDDDTTVD